VNLSKGILEYSTVAKALSLRSAEWTAPTTVLKLPAHHAQQHWYPAVYMNNAGCTATLLR
jgi:hypothetical protein